MIYLLWENFIENEKEDELMFIRNVQLNRLQLKMQIIELNADEDILQYQLIVTLLDARGMKEEGSGFGVSIRDLFELFYRIVYIVHCRKSCQSPMC